MTVRLSSVSRRFGSVVALDQVSIEAPTGAITVLLGPNGAGKTTAIRLITGALAPDVGTVEVFGVDPASNAGEEVRRRCGVVTAKPSLYDRLSGMDNLRYAAELFGLGRGSGADGRIVEAADQFGIADSLTHEVGGYSTGMKTRLALARAVLHDPDLLLLDEPTSGLDPESAASVLELIRTMTSNGRTVLMCTHLLLEAEGLADRVVVMEGGTSVVSGRPADLAAHYWPHQIVSFTLQPGADTGHLGTRAGVIGLERSDDPSGTTVTLTLDETVTSADLVAELVARGDRVTAAEPYRPTLEDLYFAVRRSHRASNAVSEPPPPSTPPPPAPPPDAPPPSGPAPSDQPPTGSEHDPATSEPATPMTVEVGS